jgi:uncharacterized cupredoxin-like copper-binding protein
MKAFISVTTGSALSFYQARTAAQLRASLKEATRVSHMGDSEQGEALGRELMLPRFCGRKEILMFRVLALGTAALVVVVAAAAAVTPTRYSEAAALVQAGTPASTAPATAAAATATTPQGAATPSATGTAAGPVQTITVKGSEFRFDPNQITLTVGQPVELVFQNVGTVDHELEPENLPAANVTVDLSKAGNIPEDEKDEVLGDAQNGEVHAYAAAGGTATIDFTPTQAGTFDFACNLPGHKEAGMVGTFVVQAASGGPSGAATGAATSAATPAATSPSGAASPTP